MVRLMPLRLVSTLFALAAMAGCSAVGAPTAQPTAPPAGGYPGWPPGTSYELIPIPVSTELTVGPNRLLVNLIDSANEQLASADRPVELRLYDLASEASQPDQSVPATYMQTVEGKPGLYRAQVSFDRPGEWGLEAVATESSGEQRVGRMVFSVRESGSTPAIGVAAPASDTPTAESADAIAAISTDDSPDPDFYELSIAEAVAAGEPFVVVFATPAFCTSATCGPTLDVVKSAAADYKDRVSFLHVEPYELAMVDGHLQPELSEQNLPIPVPAVNEWGLPTEPYVFVVDGEGDVAAKFEGIAGPDELRAALDAVAP